MKYYVLAGYTLVSILRARLSPPSKPLCSSRASRGEVRAPEHPKTASKPLNLSFIPLRTIFEGIQLANPFRITAHVTTGKKLMLSVSL